MVFARTFKPITTTVLNFEFVVPSYQKDSVGIHRFKCKQQAHNLKLVLASVHKVAVKDVGDGFHISGSVGWETIPFCGG